MHPARPRTGHRPRVGTPAPGRATGGPPAQGHRQHPAHPRAGRSIWWATIRAGRTVERGWQNSIPFKPQAGGACTPEPSTAPSNGQARQHRHTPGKQLATGRVFDLVALWHPTRTPGRPLARGRPASTLCWPVRQQDLARPRAGFLWAKKSPQGLGDAGVDGVDLQLKLNSSRMVVCNCSLSA